MCLVKRRVSPFKFMFQLPKKPKKNKKAKPFYLSLPQETLVNLGVNLTCLSLALWKVVKTLQEEFRALKVKYSQKVYI